MSPQSIVIRGQWIKDRTGRDLIVMDPTEQAYDVEYADRENCQIVKFEKEKEDK